MHILRSYYLTQKEYILFDTKEKNFLAAEMLDSMRTSAHAIIKTS